MRVGFSRDARDARDDLDDLDDLDDVDDVDRALARVDPLVRGRHRLAQRERALVPLLLAQPMRLGVLGLEVGLVAQSGEDSLRGNSSVRPVWPLSCLAAAWGC